MKELQCAPVLYDRVRLPGSGRPTIISIDLTLMNGLQIMLEGSTRGDPDRILYWTLKSTRNLAEALNESGHQISHVQVSRMLHDLGYSLQSNRKVLEGKQHVDRDEQFKYIEKSCQLALEDMQPVLSVETKKKELIGNYLNKGSQWRKSKDPDEVNVYDFPDLNVPKAIPYGIYDIGLNKGFVNVVTDHDTSQFAVESIRGWWDIDGKWSYPNIKYLIITADCGGSNGYRRKLWKVNCKSFQIT
jgi:hypothetical protein